MKHDCHEETNGDDTDNENKRKIENDRGCNTSDGVGIDETNNGNVLKAGAKLFLICTGEKHRKVLGVEGAITFLHIVKNGRIINLGSTKPLQHVEVEHRSVVE